MDRFVIKKPKLCSSLSRVTSLHPVTETKSHTMSRFSSVFFLRALRRVERLLATSVKWEHKSHIAVLRGKYRFRAVVRMVINNLQWLSDSGDQQLSQSMERNVFVLRQRRKIQTSLTFQDKCLLKTPPIYRTAEEKNQITRIIKNIKCFKQFPEDVQQKLAGHMTFEFYGPNRVIVRQGHEARGMYFLLSGEVKISVTVVDPYSKVTLTSDVGTMGAGDKFGEVSLLYNIPRTATVTTISVCEMLMLKKEDFAHVLQQTLQKQWDLHKAALSRFSYFDILNNMQLREACIYSKIVTFAPEDTVYGDGTERSNFTYFMLQGQCRLVETLRVLATRVGRKIIYRRLGENEKRQSISRDAHIETHFMQVCLFNPLQCFGLGEKMYGRRIMAVNAVECLLLPTHWLMQNSPADLWNRVRLFLQKNIPTPEDVFHKFVEQREWLRYRQELVKSIRAGRTVIDTGNSEYNVPFSIRLHENYHYYRPGF